MMKRLLVLTILSFILSVKSFAQCTPNTSITTPGIFPDSATGLASGVINMPYNQVLQMRIPADTTIIVIIFPVTIPIDSVRLISLTGLPPGLNYSCNPTNCTYLGGTNGCALIDGTPTDTGLFTVTAIVTTYAGGGQFTQTDTLNYYTIRINSSVGLSEFSPNNFIVEQNNPNPFSDFSFINYYLANSGVVDFKMVDLAGKVVDQHSSVANAGKNTFTIDARNFDHGTYIYSLTYNNRTITKRLVITGR